MSAMHVGNPSVKSPSLLSTRGLTQERNLMNVISVGNPSARRAPSLSISEHTQGRSPMNVLNAGKPSTRSYTSFNTRELTQERSPMNVATVEKPFARRHTSHSWVKYQGDSSSPRTCEYSPQPAKSPCEAPVALGFMLFKMPGKKENTEKSV